MNTVQSAREGWSETTLNYCMVVERYPNLKEEVDGSIMAVKSPLYLTRTCKVVNFLMCFGVSLSALCLSYMCIYTYKRESIALRHPRFVVWQTNFILCVKKQLTWSHV